ncbi:MAG: lipocalin family protein [Candidatus Accumulibacter sp.]|nr:lipocalin family protein [Accumulibacter sp.]
MNLRQLFASIAFLAIGVSADAQPLPTIASLDVPRYMGTWYEIARLPNRFQQKCVGQSRADYQLQDDGSVLVINRCPLVNGEMEVAVGQARQIGGPTSPKLQVRFAPRWLSFIPAVWGDYWVVDIDEAYQWVIVSEPNRQFLWILARQPRLADESLRELLLRLRQSGFSTAGLQISGQ